MLNGRVLVNLGRETNVTGWATWFRDSEARLSWRKPGGRMHKTGMSID